VCWSVLKCVKANCNYTSSIQKYQWTPNIIKLQCVAVCCSVLQRVAVRTSERRVAQRVRDRTEQILPGH